MKKRYAGFALAAVMLGASITGCGKNAQQAPAESLETEAAADGNEQQQAAASKGKWEYKEAELTMLIDSDYVQEGIKAVCDLAEQELGITVKIETRVGGADGDNIVKTRLASGDMADICGYNSGFLLSALNPSEYFIDITNEPWAGNLDDTYKGSVAVDGRTYGVPISCAYAGAVYYNKGFR